MADNAFVSPSYGNASVTDVTPSAMAALGLKGFENTLGVPEVDRIAVLLIDGLGWRQLRRHADVAPFLSAVADNAASIGRPISTPFPSTTVTSLASIGTGLPPGVHGLVGYAFRVPGQEDRVMNALRWQLYGQGPEVALAEDFPPALFQPIPTVFERARSAGVDACVVGPGNLRDSPLTRAVLRGARYESAHSLGDLAGVVTHELSAPGRRLVYAYHANLDATGHVRGADSQAWTLELGHVDRLASDIAERLGSGAALVVTGDHGMVDVPEERRLDLANHLVLAAGVQMLGGEGRARHIYVQPGAEADVVAAWRAVLADGAWVGSRDEAIEMGWFGYEIRDEVRLRIGDVLMASAQPLGVFQGHVDPVQARLLGHHGSLTPDEALVPFLLIVS
jgi:Type I phosphodiesterase / nucleotide pyrophosphatase